MEGGSLILNERGDVEPIARHSNFRVFACMNPPTDIGKKDLPPGIRNRFTEFFVDEMENPEDLKVIVMAYLKDISAAPPVSDIVDFYLAAKAAASNNLTGMFLPMIYIYLTLNRWSQPKTALQFAYLVESARVYPCDRWSLWTTTSIVRPFFLFALSSI